jgi:hypothetical protein
MPARPHRLSSRRAVLAAVAAAATGIALAGVPSAFAAGSASDAGLSAIRSATMWSIAVRADSGDGLALATLLNNAGYDVISRDGAIVHVLGGASTQTRLDTVTGATVVGRKAAAPRGAIPQAPASQDSILPRKLDGKTYQTFYGGYRTVAAYHKFESDLVKKYPNLVQKITYGTSFTGANPLIAMCLTADATSSCQLTPDVDKARFLVMTQIHAREIATSEMAWRLMTRLIDGYQKDAQITSLLQSTEIWVVPEVNPDGIVTVQNGIAQHGTGQDSPAWQRKNMDEDQAPAGGCGGTWAFSQSGVDLNRNNTFHWGGQGSSSDPCEQTFKGKAAGSEPEDSTLATLFRSLFKDQRGSGASDPAPPDTTGAMVTIHTVAGLVMLPWSYDASVHTPNDAALRSMAFRQNYFNHYTAGQSGEVLYNAAGTSDDLSYSDLGIASFTWELDGSGGSCQGEFLPPYSCMDAYETNNLPGLYYDAAAARTPYLLSLGPTTTSASTTGSGSSVTVTMAASDSAYGTSGVGKPAAQNVTDARIYVGTAPWDGGTSQPMSIHGSGTSVTATATVDKGSARVLAWVQAMDAAGNWGPAFAVWIPKA